MGQLGISKELYEIKYSEHVDDTSEPNTLEIYYQSVVPVNNLIFNKKLFIKM